VFVVDDERVIASTLAAILQINGLDARFFFSGREALEAACLEKPDLLISDVVMPELSGVSLAIRMKATCPGCKVLLFSGQAATSDLLRQARDQGHDFELLSKPLHPAAMLLRIKLLLLWEPSSAI
jgi:DNA-binding response OmpR family regulator